jgi:hypothetical protein
MKISLMILLIVTIAALSRLAITGSPTGRVAADQLPRGMESILPRSAIGGRNMWISIFTVAAIAAVCLGIAAFLMQPAELV